MSVKSENFKTGISSQRSIVTLPETGQPYPALLDFLCLRFPYISRGTWEERIREHKVIAEGKGPVSLDTPYVPRQRLFYFREVEDEPCIPFKEEILFLDDDLLVAFKPHFLPVTPGGRFVEECLQNRLRRRTGNDELQSLHRIDRATSGIVLFSCRRKTRGLYQELFRRGEVEKTYEALSECSHIPLQRSWTVHNRLERGEPKFRMRICPGEPNALSKIRLTGTDGNRLHFELQPVTGRTHQLRVHMCFLGFPILGDRFYPELLPEQDDDFNHPLTLLARSVSFQDPLTGKKRDFAISQTLFPGRGPRHAAASPSLCATDDAHQ